MQDFGLREVDIWCGLKAEAVFVREGSTPEGKTCTDCKIPGGEELTDRGGGMR
jgi:hypothetical protein